MKSYVFSLLLLPLLAPAPEAQVASAQVFTEVEGVRRFSGELIVRPRSADREDADRVEAALSARLAHELVQSSFDTREYIEATDEYVVRIQPGQENEVAASLRGTGWFEYAVPNWILFPTHCPDDLEPIQWHHDRIESCEAWCFEEGAPSVGVGICDTGVRVSHQDLMLNRLEGYDAVDQVWELDGGDISDVHGHGTLTTGAAAANGDNGVGVVGVGWNISHRMLRVSKIASGGASHSVLLHAARTAIESGDRVASVSYSGAASPAVLSTATYIKSQGGLLVWAAANDSVNMTLNDRDDDDVIVVGATDQNDALAGFSNYGPFVDMVAPGVAIYTTARDHDAAYQAVNGTSLSCPIVAGAIAVIWSEDPTLTPDEVEDILKQGCDDLGAVGVDSTFGYGRLNLRRSVQAAAGVPDSGDSGGWAETWAGFDAGGGAIEDYANLYPGDYDGDGEEELLGVSGSWMTMFYFENGDWNWGWSNYGDPAAGDGIYPYRDRFEVGDFDGDGADELLGTGPGWMTMFHFENGDWHWGWSNYGDPAVGDGIYPYRDHFEVGDFDGDCADELLGIGPGWMTMFHFENGDWNWGWSNYGDPAVGDGIYPYKEGLQIGDFDGDGRDEALGFGTTTWVTMFHFDADADDWHWGWSNYGDVLAFAGWELPLASSTVLLVANVEDIDTNDELVLIERGPGADAARVVSFASGAPSTTWSACTPFLGTWALPSLSSTEYWLVEAEATKPANVLARRFGYNPMQMYSRPDSPDTWTHQGFALPGVTGDPLLVGSGDLTAGSSNPLELCNAAPAAPAWLCWNLESAPVGMFGGTVVPGTGNHTSAIMTSAVGEISVGLNIPSTGLPVGTEFWLQWLIWDTAAVHSVAMSNAIKGVSP